MDTKAKTKIWLLDKSPPIFSISGAQGFNSALPPTGEDVLLQVQGYKKFLSQEKAAKEDRTVAAVRMVNDDLQGWWIKTGIAVKSSSGIGKMINKLFPIMII